MIQRIPLFLAIVLCSLDLAWADDWPQWRGPERTGVSKEKGLLPSWPAGGPKLLWTFRDAGAGHSSMSVVGKRLYSMGADDDKEYVYAIDLKTQKKIWSVEIGAPFIDAWDKGPTSTPTMDGDFLYALGSRGNLVCLERASGKKIWSQELESDLGGTHPFGCYSESPLIDGDQLVVTPGGGGGAIAAFDKKTGKLKWRSTDYTASAYFSSLIAITVGGVRQYVQVTTDGIAGVKAADGELLWELQKIEGLDTKVEALNTPLYHNDCIYVPCGYGPGNPGCLLLKLLPDGDKFKVKQVYTNREMQNDHGGVIPVGDYLYGYSRKGGWICQDFKMGKTIWKKDLKMGMGSVVFADGNLYGYHEKSGDVLLLKATPKGYREQGRFRIPEETKLPRDDGKIWAHPVVANGKLYLRDNDLIFCYDICKHQ